jgi:hypothetical protein
MKTAANRIGIGALWIAGALSVWAQDSPRGMGAALWRFQPDSRHESRFGQEPKWLDRFDFNSGAERIGHSARRDHLRE